MCSQTLPISSHGTLVILPGFEEFSGRPRAADGAPRRAAGEDRVARGLVPRDILARFDIDVCQVGLTLATGSDGLPEENMWPPLRDVCSGQRTYLFGRDDVEGNIRARTAHCLFLDNPRLRDRVAKYEARGFEFAPWEAEHDAAVARMVALEAIFALPQNTERWQRTPGSELVLVSILPVEVN